MIPRSLQLEILLCNRVAAEAYFNSFLTLSGEAKLEPGRTYTAAHSEGPESSKKQSDQPIRVDIVPSAPIPPPPPPPPLEHSSQSVKLTSRTSEIYYHNLDKAEYYGLDFAYEASISREIDHQVSNKPYAKSSLEGLSLDSGKRSALNDIEQTLASNNHANDKNRLAQKNAGEEDEMVQAIAMKKPKKAIANVDYSEIFDLELLSSEYGLFSWRIENLTPIMQDEPHIFCPKDCYLVLHTEEDKPAQIWSWIGKDAEMDKCFCCALFAVALRDSIKAECRIIRLEQGDEQDDDEENCFLSVISNCMLHLI